LTDRAAALGFRWEIVRAAEYPPIEHGEPPSGVLSRKEAETLNGLRFLQRRRKWLLGRVAAKKLIEEAFGAAAQAITIANEPSGAPYAEIEGQGRIDRALSISHRADWGLAALGDPGVIALGVDVETIEPRDDSFIADFFTPEEVAAVSRAGGERDLAIARTWSAKEAALKALGVGLRVDTRAIHVSETGGDVADGWAPIAVAASGELTFPGPARAFWRQGPGYVVTAVVL
jgi:4'-phosphopantetheinyl transferase